MGIVADDTTKTDGTQTGADVQPESKGNEETTDKNPLLPDLQKWKDEARDAKARLAQLEAEREQAKKDAELAAAKDLDELKATIQKHKAEAAAKERQLTLRAAAAEAGVDGRFMQDDGSPVEQLVAQAKAEQDKFLATHTAKTKVNNIGGGSSPVPEGGAVFSTSQIAKMSADEYRKHRDSILEAQAAGKVLKD